MQPLPIEATAFVATSDHGNAQRRAHARGKKVIVVEVAVDEIEGVLPQVFSESRAVSMVGPRSPVFQKVKIEEGFYATVAGSFDDPVSLRLGARRTGEFNIHTEGTQGDAQIERRFGRPRPFAIAEEVENPHAIMPPVRP